MTSFKDIQEEYAELYETVRQQRDELRVQIHLAGMEAKDEWDELERQWEHLRSKTKELKDIAGDSATDVSHNVKELAHNIKIGYQKIRDSL